VSNDDNVEAETTLDKDGEALFEELTYKAVNAHLKTPIFSYSFVVDPSKGVEEVKLPLTPASTALLSAVALTASLATALIVARRRRGGEKSAQ
jgi:hypothetical protein